jgi:hypothetical protein
MAHSFVRELSLEKFFALGAVLETRETRETRDGDLNSRFRLLRKNGAKSGIEVSVPGLPWFAWFAGFSGVGRRRVGWLSLGAGMVLYYKRS